MNLESKRELLDALKALGPNGTEPNKAANYIAFGVKTKNKYRIAVSVERKGTKFFTEDRNLLVTLAAKGIVSQSCDNGRPRDKNRHLFPSLTTDQVQDGDNKDEFRKLVHDSVGMKEKGF